MHIILSRMELLPLSRHMGDHWIQTCLCQPYYHSRLSAGWPGSELGGICVAWEGDSRSMGRGCHPFSDELGAFLGVDLQAGLESWWEHGGSLCHSKKETANNREREVPRAFSGNPNLQQGQQGSSHWVWVIAEEQLGDKIRSQSNTLLYAMAASLLGSEQRQLCQFATITVQRLWVTWHDITTRSPPVCQSSPPPLRSAVWAVAPSSYLILPVR